jgi:hypothetical protein
VQVIRARPGEVDRSCFLEGDRSAAATVIQVDELDAVRQLAVNDRRMTAELRSVQLIRFHDIDDARTVVEVCDGTPVATDVAHEH